MDIFDQEEVDTRDMTKDNFEKLINMSDCGMMIVRLQAEPEIIYANDYYYQNLQYTREEYEDLFGNTLMGPLVEEEKQKIKNLIARQSAAGGSIHLEFRVNRKDGTVIWTSFCAKKGGFSSDMYYYCSCLDVTASKRHLDDVYKAKHELDVIANSIPGGVVKLRMSDYLMLYANDGFFRLAGYSRSEYNMQFHNCTADLLHPDDKEMVDKVVRQAISNHGPLGLEYRIIHKNGEVRWSYINGTRIEDDHGAAVFLCVIVDITSRKRIEAELADKDHRSDVISKMLNETIWTYDVGSDVLYRSGQLGTTYSADSVLEKQFSSERVRDFIHPEDVDRFLKKKEKWIQEPTKDHDIFRMVNEQGEYRNIEVHVCSESGNGNTVDKVYGVTREIRDVGDEEESLSRRDSIKKAEGKLLKMVKISQSEPEDTITGLLPYAEFLRKAERIILDRSGEEHYALICADINEFQKVSHHYGFYISNQILKTFSDVLLKNLSKDGMCARVDADYFVVLFQYQDHKQLVKAMSAVVRHQEKMEQDEDFIEFGSTVGVYLVQEGDHELLDMLEKADLARRSIKGLRGNHYAIYTEDVAKSLSTEDEMIEDVKRAMANDTVEIYYLPRIREDKEHIIGCKAVPRILMKSGQYLEYKHIMHLMERGAQLNEFSFYILRKVTDNLGVWKAKGNDVIPVSVELTASQLSTTQAVNRIHEMIVRNHLEPKDFIFEIPERFFAEGTTAFEMAIQTLSKLGYQIYITRFGADHTAVNSMRRLSISGIKFHGEYFSEHMINEKDTIVLKKVVEMAKEMGMGVSCGGIYTKLQEDFAKKLGCNIFEGDYYFGAVKNIVFEKCFLVDNYAQGNLSKT